MSSSSNSQSSMQCLLVQSFDDCMMHATNKSKATQPPTTRCPTFSDGHAMLCYRSYAMSEASKHSSDHGIPGEDAKSLGRSSATIEGPAAAEASLSLQGVLPVYVGSMVPLGPDYVEPGPLDVICGRGKQALRHSGNLKLRATIESKLEEYSRATTKLEKSMIVSGIMDGVRDDSPGGGFVKFEKGEWFEVGDHLAREKIGQSFRDLLHLQYKSSTKAKGRRRKSIVATGPNNLVMAMDQPVEPASPPGTRTTNSYKGDMASPRATDWQAPSGEFRQEPNPAKLDSPSSLGFFYPVNYAEKVHDAEHSPSLQQHHTMSVKDKASGSPTSPHSEPTSLVALLCPKGNDSDESRRGQSR